MSEDLRTELRSALEDAGPPPDLLWVVGRGSQLRRRNTVLSALAVLAFVGVTTAGAATIFRSGDGSPSVGGGPASRHTTPDVQQPREGEIVEEISEEQRADIFAFRAVSASGLMRQDGRAYFFTYEDDTTEDGGVWKVGFSASQCDGVNCRPLTEEPPDGGMPLAETFVVVGLRGSTWQVMEVEGDMAPEEEEKLIGYSLPDQDEPSHWDFSAVTVSRGSDGAMVQFTPVWVGPYPTRAPGSVCRLTVQEGAGSSETVFYQPPPARVLERGGWVQGRELPRSSDDVDVHVDCRQYTGPGWELEGEPELVRSNGDVVGISARLEWRGEEGFTTGARCDGTLLDGDGEVVFEGSGRIEPLWRPGELKDYPYRETLVVTTRGEPVQAERVGDFTCESV